MELSDGKGRPFHVRMTFSDGRMASIAYGWPPPPGYHVRTAGGQDIAAIAAVEHDAPIETADGGRFVVFRPNLRQMLTLQEERLNALIERDGVPVAARGWALRAMRVDGRDRVLGTSQIARVLPAARGDNLMRAFPLWDSSEVAPRRDEYLAYVDPGIQAVMGSLRSEGDAWRRRALELTLPCAALAGPACGQLAVAADASIIATLANAAHGRCALYMPLDAARVAQRMTRAPDAYTWHDVLIGARMMVGAWASGDETVTYTPDATTVRRRLWVVLDHGWDRPDAADEVVALLCAHAARAHAGGASHLTLYTLRSPVPRWTASCRGTLTNAWRSACRRRSRSRTTPMACIRTHSISDRSALRFEVRAHDTN